VIWSGGTKVNRGRPRIQTVPGARQPGLQTGFPWSGLSGTGRRCEAVHRRAGSCSYLRRVEV